MALVRNSFTNQLEMRDYWDCDALKMLQRMRREVKWEGPECNLITNIIDYGLGVTQFPKLSPKFKRSRSWRMGFINWKKRRKHNESR